MEVLPTPVQPPNHLKLREDCLGKGSMERAECQREAIQNLGTNPREGTLLPCGGASKRNIEKILFKYESITSEKK